MKYILLSLVITVNFLGCQNKKEASFGDSLISNKKFIDKLEKLTVENISNDYFPLEKMKFNYTDSNNTGDVYNKSNILLRTDINYKSYQIEENGYNKIINNETYLKTYKNEVLVDSILIYKKETTDYSSLTDYYYLDTSLNLWILEILLPLEDNSPINFWNKYKIDSSTGEIKLIKRLIKDRFPKSNFYSKIEIEENTIIQSYSFDINKDGIDDKIILKKSLDEINPKKTDYYYDNNVDLFRELIIYYGNNEGKYKEIVSSEKAIPMKEDGGYAEDAFENIEYKNNYLIITTNFANKTSNGWYTVTNEFYFKLINNQFTLEKIEIVDDLQKNRTIKRNELGTVLLENFNVNTFDKILKQ